MSQSQKVIQVPAEEYVNSPKKLADEIRRWINAQTKTITIVTVSTVCSFVNNQIEQAAIIVYTEK